MSVPTLPRTTCRSESFTSTWANLAVITDRKKKSQDPTLERHQEPECPSGPKGVEDTPSPQHFYGSFNGSPERHQQNDPKLRTDGGDTGD